LAIPWIPAQMEFFQDLRLWLIFLLPTFTVRLLLTTLKAARKINLLNFARYKPLIFNMPVWRNGRRTGLKIAF
jgi:hypothetical protein